MFTPRRFAVIVCIAVFALTALTAMPIFALLDAQTPIDGLFGDLPPVLFPASEDEVLPPAPDVHRRSSRAPPLA